MKETILPDLRMIGTSTASGGRFRDVRITGECVLSGDTECRHFRCTGNADLEGNLRAESFNVTGNGKIAGSMTAGKIRMLGELEVAGKLQANRVHITGQLRVAGPCEAEHAEIRGAVDVGGLLNAERLTVRTYGPCTVQEIGGGSVTAKRSRAAALKNMFGISQDARLTVRLIEGDHVHLEHTTAEIVRGNRVTLGAGCEIGRVEYRQELRLGSGAYVQDKIRL